MKVKYVSATSFKEYNYTEIEIKAKTLSNPENNTFELNKEMFKYFNNIDLGIYEELLKIIKLGNPKQYDQLMHKQQNSIDMEPYNNQRIKGSIQNYIYLVINGILHHIPVPKTYQQMFGNDNGWIVLEQSLVDKMPKSTNPLPNSSGG